ncbi:uncharacterized protein RCC_08875 [Ramularia collo-cygni]|uniref:F-box domain-containing protein n=1 Tax=Ramularia collo-cygni TaxID=112498 RepID=A0A2D3VBV5_9PEZI|nr:uncharacterized protein RCC_08875 [Ramularia collo-cygni]CZT23165.1 uncharacterized protein RCC_08875 [Ramularia collo-cygni]
MLFPFEFAKLGFLAPFLKTLSYGLGAMLIKHIIELFWKSKLHPSSPKSLVVILKLRQKSPDTANLMTLPREVRAIITANLLKMDKDLRLLAHESSTDPAVPYKFTADVRMGHAAFQKLKVLRTLLLINKEFAEEILQQFFTINKVQMEIRRKCWRHYREVPDSMCLPRETILIIPSVRFTIRRCSGELEEQGGGPDFELLIKTMKLGNGPERVVDGGEALCGDARVMQLAEFWTAAKGMRWNQQRVFLAIKLLKNYADGA